MNRQINSLSPEPSSAKLKGSCDNCSAAKVRCTKEKPSCARCLKSGSTCLYSPARRFGRPHQRPPPRRRSPPFRLADHHTDLEIGLEPEHQRSFGQPTTQTVAMVPITVTRQSAQADTEAHHVHDCFQLITGLLQDLDSPTAGPPHVDAMLSRLALTLICNCSQQQDLSLLVVMGCHAALDRVSVLGRCDKLARETYLRKVTGLVAQLTRRYCGSGAPEELARTIPGLALELKLRLQEITAQSRQEDEVVGDMGLGLVGGGAFTYEDLDLGECLL